MNVNIMKKDYFKEDNSILEEDKTSFYGEILKIILLPAVLMTLDGKILEANDSFFQLLNCDRQDFYSQSGEIIIPRDQENNCRIIANSFMAKGECNYGLLSGKDGNLHRFILAPHVMGEVAVVFILDINDSLELSPELMLSESHYRCMVENSLDGLCVIDYNKMLYFNDRFVELLGYSRKEIESLHPLSLVAPYDRDRVKLKFSHGFQNTLLLKEIMEIDCLQPDGSIINCEAAISSIIFHDNYGLQVSIKDISELKRKESERNALISKFTLIGEMAASIAHEIRNPMTTVRGLAQILADEDDTHQEYYGLIIEELDRANKLLNDFLSLAKNGPANYELLDINKLILKCMKIIYGELFGNQIALVMELDKSSGKYVNADADKLKQAIINISKNAIEAMAPGGLLIVSTAVQNGKVYISFIDNGIGIPFAARQKVMQPFYSTKPAGTGLGLSVSFKMIQDNGGDLLIESQEDAGTTVVIKLPLAKT